MKSTQNPILIFATLYNGSTYIHINVSKIYVSRVVDYIVSRSRFASELGDAHTQRTDNAQAVTEQGVVLVDD